MIHREPKNGEAFEVAVRRVGPAISVTVDGEMELSWTDDGPGALLGDGYFGLRQMATMATVSYDCPLTTPVALYALS